MSLDDLVRRAERLAAEPRTGPLGRAILGITGPPGAGKSTLAGHLAAALGPARAVLVGMDGFHLANDILRHHGSLPRKGAIDTFDEEGYASLIERLASAQQGDKPVYAPLFDRAIEDSLAAAVEVPSGVPLVITEGNYLLADTGAWPRARAAMTEIWYLYLPDEVRRHRLIARHQRYGRTRDEATKRALGPDEDNARLIATTAHLADIVIRQRIDLVPPPR